MRLVDLNLNSMVIVDNYIKVWFLSEEASKKESTLGPWPKLLYGRDIDIL